MQDRQFERRPPRGFLRFSFSLDNEAFSVTPLPSCRALDCEMYTVTLTKLGGELCLAHRDTARQQPVLWTTADAVNPHPHMRHTVSLLLPVFHYPPRPVAMLRGGNGILVQRGRHLCRCDLRGGRPWAWLACITGDAAHAQSLCSSRRSEFELI